MKIQPDSMVGINTISKWQNNTVWVNAQPYSQAIIVPWQANVLAWPVSQFEQLQPEHLASLLPFKPEVVIFGSGLKLRFPHATILLPLLQARVGVETMDSASACRTYNVLAQEGRHAVLALLIEDAFP
jgi:uncharacterized protein